MERDIRDLVFGLRKSLDDIDAQLKAIEKSDTFKENTELAQKNAKLAARLEKTEGEAARLSTSNAALKNALYEQYFNEKVSTVDKARRNLAIFFAHETRQELNRLTLLEDSIKQRLGQLTLFMARARIDLGNETHDKITHLQIEVSQKIEEARLEAAKISVSEAEKAELERLKQESLTGEQITALSRKNNFERYIGLNILNTVGIVLFIIGAIAAGQFGYTWVSFALGAGFLVAGEFLNRKRPNIFSLGITAGGVGILYVSLALGHFLHHTISIYPALGICVAITALAFYLATRYKAQTLLAITLVGGYLPILSILLDGVPPQELVFGMMAYFVLFNLLALSLAFRNKWTAATFVGLALNIVGTMFIVDAAHSIIINIIYIAFAMLVYNAIPIISTHLAKAKFRPSDLVLISINTFFGGFVMLGYMHDWFRGQFLGLVAAIYAALYWSVSRFIAKKFEGERHMSNLFFLAGVVFAFAFVPLQFDLEWLTPGWMMLAVALSVFGIISEMRWTTLWGLVVGAAGLGWFVFIDLAWFIYGDNPYFTMQYVFVTGATLLIFAAFITKGKLHSAPQRAFKYCTAVNLWLFAVFMITRLWEALLVAFSASLISVDYLMGALIAVSALVFGKVYSKIPRLVDGGMKIIGTILTILGLVGIFIINLASNPGGSGEITVHPTNIVIIATAILIAVEATVIYAIYDLTRRAVLEKIIGIQFLPLVVSTYIVLVFTLTLTLDYGLSFASFWISAAYVVTALLWTIIGFIRRYALLRRFGLALALFSVVKLFLFDLRLLTQGFQILSYFVMGAILVIISFVYQYFSKRLELGVK